MRCILCGTMLLARGECRFGCWELRRDGRHPRRVDEPPPLPPIDWLGRAAGVRARIEAATMRRPVVVKTPDDEDDDAPR